MYEVPKLPKFVKRGYISQGSVTSLISYFSVPKEESDIRLVFDGTKSGLKSKLWAPSFCLPFIESLLPMLEHHFYTLGNKVLLLDVR